jgi:hypothetical protein
VSLTGGSDNIGDFQRRRMRRSAPLKGGSRPFRCYVNPALPEQAVLFRDLRWGLMLLMSIFPTAFPLAGAVSRLAAGCRPERPAGRKLEEQHPARALALAARVGGRNDPGLQATACPFILGIAGWILLVQGPLALAVIVSGDLTRSPAVALALLPSLLA